MIALAGVLFFFCVAFRVPLESDPVTHVLVQLPLLAVSGALLVRGQSLFTAEWNNGGVATLLIALFSIAYWMLPRAIDAALASPYIEFAKFVSIPLLVGVPLAAGWSRAHPVLRGFLKAQAISMLGVLAFLYTHAPIRICNAYLVGDQQRLGIGFLIVAIGVSVLWIIPLFTRQTSLESTQLKMAQVR